MVTFEHAERRPPGWENPALWRRCRAQAREAMIAAGWPPLSKKFSEALTRKTLQLYRKALQPTRSLSK